MILNNHQHLHPLQLFPSKQPPLLHHLHLFLPSVTTSATFPRLQSTANHSAAAAADIEMSRGRDGVYTARDQKVVVLWDLDNKPPHGPPYDAALALRYAAELFGRVVDISAYANRHAFLHLPQWVLQERRDRRRLDVLERKGLAPVDEPYICGVCGRKCRTNLDLKKHFRQLHARERQKKINRMQSLKGKKRQKYRERFISGNTKYEETERELLTPKTGYGLASELRRAGVYVKTVEDKPQAADWAVKRQMQHSMTRGIDWIFLVSDDSDFCEMVRRAREADLRIVVVGDTRTALGRQADLWVPWRLVESGEVTRDLFQSGLETVEENYYYGDEGDDKGIFESATFYQSSVDIPDLDHLVDEILVGTSPMGGLRISAFAEQDIVDDDEAGDFLLDSDDEEDDDYI